MHPWLCIGLFVLVAHQPLAAASAEEIRQAVGAQYDQAFAAHAGAVKGLDGWYFLSAELRSYSRGPFWGADAATASRADKDQDPRVAIHAFAQMVEKAGVSLIVVPVAGKISVYADKLDPALVSDARWDVSHQSFCAALVADGVQILDLQPAFSDLRAHGTASHCQQDSHWSPAAMQFAAERIAALIKQQPWYAASPKHTVTRHEAATIAIHGDLTVMLKDDSVPAESLSIQTVDGGDPDKNSPIVLMGDSHTLVYHDHELLADHAGLPEHLAAELGMGVDLVGVRGSGANASRAQLARRKDNLAGKKCLVWVFAAREFTESIEGWKLIPVIR